MQKIDTYSENNDNNNSITCERFNLFWNILNTKTTKIYYFINFTINSNPASFNTIPMNYMHNVFYLIQ